MRSLPDTKTKRICAGTNKGGLHPEKAGLRRDAIRSQRLTRSRRNGKETGYDEDLALGRGKHRGVELSTKSRAQPPSSGDCAQVLELSSKRMGAEVDYKVAAPAEMRTPNLHRGDRGGPAQTKRTHWEKNRLDTNRPSHGRSWNHQSGMSLPDRGFTARSKALGHWKRKSGLADTWAYR